jgi:hypothetical protein
MLRAVRATTKLSNYARLRLGRMSLNAKGPTFCDYESVSLQMTIVLDIVLERLKE